MKPFLSFLLVIFLLGFSSAGLTKVACYTIESPDVPKPTQLFLGNEANCTCKFPMDCDIEICEGVDEYVEGCEVSPS